MLFSLNENSESVSGFVAEQNLTNLLNLIYAFHTVYYIIVNNGVTGEQIKAVHKKVFLPRQMCFNPGWMGGPESI